MFSKTLKFGVVMAILVGAAFGSSAAWADDGELPDGMEIHKRSIEASGGAEVREKITSRVMKATFTTPTPGVIANMEVYEASPGKRSLRMSYMGRLVHAATTDGDQVWQVEAGSQPVLVEGTQKAAFITEARMGMDNAPQELYESMETVAETEFAGEPAYEVKLVTKHGARSTHYYSVESGLMIGRASPARPDEQAMETRVTLSDFREVDGLTMAFRSELFFPATGTTQVMTVTSVEHNVEIDPAIFEMPEALKKQPEPSDD